MRSTLTPAPLLTLLALAPAVALSHRGWSGHDSGKALTFTETICEVGAEHPHGFVKVETPGKNRLVVLAPPSRMENRGDEARYLHEAAERSNLHPVGSTSGRRLWSGKSAKGGRIRHGRIRDGTVGQ